MILTGPTMKRGRSKQDYRTPKDFMDAVQKRFGKIVFDLAASPHNTQHARYFSVADNSLAQSWHDIRRPRLGWLWLNPPFDNIGPWARKCATEVREGARILFLTPASIGSNWFEHHVHHRALVMALNGRLCFDGKNPYPKDLILSVYDGSEVIKSGFDTWSWRK